LIQLKLSGHIKNIIAIFKEVDEARKRLWLMQGLSLLMSYLEGKESRKNGCFERD